MKKASRTPIRRILWIDQQLREGRYPNRNQLAEALEVDPKTIQRDLDYMRDQLDAPIEFCRKRNGYHYSEPNFFLPMINLRERDVFAFVIAEKILKQCEGAAYYKEIQEVLNKISNFLPDAISVQEAAKLFEFESARSSPVDAQKIALLQECARLKKVAIIQYYSFHGQEKTTRSIHPYHLLNHEGSWYCVAYCVLRNDIRTFAISRMLSIEGTNEKFERAKDFNIKRYVQESFSLTRETKDITARIKFSPYQAQWIREKRWHPTQTIEELPDGGLILTLTVKGIADLKRWILKYGAEAEVLSPAELRSAIAEEARLLCGKYFKNFSDNM
ncbi:MAG: WYL domain-containing protein [Chloroherpetonaceae bacterium]|nr:WYL domain-containing protein [Chloroherpetonaceae bacterium]MDW8438083.1 WYL domain-containing protein [Chloroherpetonaceae bacterium]